jgi:vacuolar-type H+-ATPase subunit E/Vma4
VTGWPEQTRAALQPLRAALLAAATEQAQAIVADSEDEGRELLASARRERDAVVDEARQQGEQEAALRLRSQRARAHRKARELVLEAQRAAYDDLRRAAGAAVRDLLSDPREMQRWSAAVSARLGATAVVREARGGGVVGETEDGRVMDASVATVVDQAVAELDLECLWTPS